MNEEIRKQLDKLVSQKTVNAEKALEVLSKFSLEMLKERDGYLAQGEYQRAKQVHYALARLYKQVGKNVSKKYQEFFKLLNYYWRTTGNKFQQASPPIKVKPIESFPEREKTTATDPEAYQLEQEKTQLDEMSVANIETLLSPAGTTASSPVLVKLSRETVS